MKISIRSEAIRTALEVPADNLKPWSRYTIAILALVVATLLRMAVDPIVGDLHPFVTYIFATIFTAWCCGFWPAALSLILGFLAAAYFFVTPRGSFAMAGVDVHVGVFLYVVVAIASISLSQLTQNANRRVKAKSLLLERKQIDLERVVLERQTAEQETVDLLRRFVNLQEEERQRISRELHDQCGQELVALQLVVKRLGDLARNENRPTMQPLITEIDELLTRLSRELHDLAFDLRPATLDELGIRTATASLLKIWQDRTAIKVDFECPNSITNALSSEVSLTLYRVLQESLNNVAKHSRSTQVSIILELQRDQALLIVEDNGVGLNHSGAINESSSQRSLGIQGMRERLAAVGGSFEIESSPGKGTTVFARVPCIGKIVSSR